MDPLKMYILLKMGIFHCYVGLSEGKPKGPNGFLNELYPSIPDVFLLGPLIGDFVLKRLFVALDGMEMGSTLLNKTCINGDGVFFPKDVFCFD